MSSDLIPLTLLTGFLGSGKTTVLNHLVRQPEMANALVIINEFGAVGLDHLLVSYSAENIVVEMNSGCLCCTIRSDLVKTLREVSWRFARNGERRFDRVVIETTGLADPAPIIHTLMTDPFVARRYRLDGIVSTIDLAVGTRTLDAHVEAVKQAAVADCLVLTKADQISDHGAADALLKRLARINPAARRITAHHGAVAAKSLLNLGLFNASTRIPDVQRWLNEEAYPGAMPEFSSATEHEHPAHEQRALKDPAGTAEGHRDAYHEHDVNRHDDHIRAFCFVVDEPIAGDLFAAWLDLLVSLVGKHMLRIKGVLNIEGDPRPLVIHGVQHFFYPPVHLPAWPTPDRRSKMVFITRDVESRLMEEIWAKLITRQHGLEASPR